MATSSSFLFQIIKLIKFPMGIKYLKIILLFRKLKYPISSGIQGIITKISN